MATEKIYVICPVCGTANPCGILVPIEFLEDPSNTLRDNVSACQNQSCRHHIQWSKAELWPESFARSEGKIP